MRTKSVVLLAMALGCGLVASVAISQVVMDQKGQKPEMAMVDILIAAKDIDAAGKLSKDNIKIEKWPKDRVPKGAIQDFKEIDGKFANQSLFQGEPIVQKKLINAVDSLSVTIPKGYRLFDLKVNAENGGVGYVKPGDHVDVFGYFEKGPRIPETKTMVVLENVIVKAIDGNAVRDNGEQTTKMAKTIQLLIKDSQYRSALTADNLGKLRVALRAPEEDSAAESEFENGATFLNWIRNVDESIELANANNSKTQPNATMPSNPAPSNQSEMVVITPSGLSRYRWRGDDGIPELVKDDDAAESMAGLASQLVSGAQSNTVWNPKSSQWSTSGFAPNYPSADGTPAPPPSEPLDHGKR